MNKPYDRQLKRKQCQCMECFEYFKSEAAFNKHRVGEYPNFSRRCLTTGEMIEKGMVLNKSEFWITSRRPQNFTPTSASGVATVVNGS